MFKCNNELVFLRQKQFQKYLGILNKQLMIQLNNLMNSNKSLFKEFEEEIDQTNKIVEDKGIRISVDKEEFYIENESLVQNLYPLLSKVKNCYDSKTKIFKIPKSIDKNTFELFLHFLCYFNLAIDLNSESSLNKVDLVSIRNSINVCLFFDAIDMIYLITNQFLAPKIDKENCLEIIKNYLDLANIENIKELFTEIIKNCINCASTNILYLLNHQKDKLISLRSDSLEEIIAIYFKTFFYTNSSDDSQIMNLLMYNRKIKNDIFELLENERKRAISTFEEYYSHKKTCIPSLICKIKCDDPLNGVYREEQFQIENIDVMLMIYYNSKDDIFNLALQILRINPLNQSCTITNDHGIDKNNDYSDLGSSIINLNNKSLENISENHIISILSVCEIEDIKFQTKTNFNCIYSNSKSRVLVFKIEKFSHYFSKESSCFSFDFSLRLHFSLNYNFSSILNHICKTFYDYYSLSSISKISKIVLNIILKNESLNCRNEDEVLFAVTNWVSTKNNYHLLGSIDLFKNINWKNVSLDALISLLLFENKSLLAMNELKTIVFGEFRRRFQEEYLCCDKDYSVSMTETEIYDSTSNFNRIKYSHFTNDFLNQLITVSDKYNLSTVIKTDKKEAQEQGISLTLPTVEKESSLETVNKPNRNKSNGSYSNSLTNNNPITTSFLVKKNDKQTKTISSVRNIPTMSTINRIAPMSLNKTKPPGINQQRVSKPNIQININTDVMNNFNSNFKSKLKGTSKKYDNSIIGRLLGRAATPDNVMNKQCSILNLNKSNHSSLTNKSNSKSLEKKNKSKSRFPNYLIQNNYLSIKGQKSASKDRNIPIGKHIISSTRCELIKTEPQVCQAKKMEMKRFVHYRSQSNH